MADRWNVFAGFLFSAFAVSLIVRTLEAPMNRIFHGRTSPSPRPSVARLLLVATTLTACGSSGGGTPPAPHIVPGGAVGDGPIAGHLGVYVTDDDTRAPVSSAQVRVGGSADVMPCLATTDSTGLAVFDTQTCKTLRGPQTVTAWSDSHVPTTWIGVNGTNLTMTVRPKTRAAVQSATVSGSIAGWDALPAPAVGHTTLAIVGFSQSSEFGDRVNDVMQGMRDITVLGLGSFPVPANVCVRNLLVNNCEWRMNTRIGKQAHFAIVFDQDENGTPNDDSDDIRTVIAWAVKPGLTFVAGDTAGGEVLTLLTDAEMQDFTVSIPTPPTGLADVAAYPALDLGDAGRVVIVFPELDLTHVTTRVPRVSGALAGGHYDLIARAQPTAADDSAQTLAWLRSVNPSATVAISTWMPLPTGLSASGGTYAFTRVAGADLHSADLETTTDDRMWSVTIFDGSSSFTLPGLLPDPIGTGTVHMKVNAIEVPGIDVNNVDFDVARDKLTGLSSAQITFTH